jgi:small basic protein
MGAFGTFLGALFAVTGISLIIWMTFSITENFLPLLLFAVFGLIGGLGLGALNTKKAKKQKKYQNEYMLYGFVGLIAIIALAVYYIVISPGKRDSEIS